MPINPKQLTLAQTALQRLPEKHPDFEIQAVKTIRPPEIEYTRTSQPLVPVDAPLLVIRPSDIDKIVKSIETRVIHRLELLIQAQDLVKAYQTSMHFQDIYHYITDGKLPSGTKAQNCNYAEALNYIVVKNFLFRIDTQKETMPQAFGDYHLLLVITCDQTNFTITVPLRDRQTQTVAKALIYNLPRQIVCDEASEFTSAIVQAILTMLNCRLKVISPYNHGSSKCKKQIKTISEIIVKHLWDKGQMWPLFATTTAYVMNTFASEALSGFSPFQLIFLREPPDLTSLSFPKINTIPVNYREYYNLLLARAQIIGRLLLNKP